MRIILNLGNESIGKTEPNLLLRDVFFEDDCIEIGCQRFLKKEAFKFLANFLDYDIGFKRYPVKITSLGSDDNLTFNFEGNNIIELDTCPYSITKSQALRLFKALADNLGYEVR